MIKNVEDLKKLAQILFHGAFSDRSITNRLTLMKQMPNLRCITLMDGMEVDVADLNTALNDLSHVQHIQLKGSYINGTPTIIERLSKQLITLHLCNTGISTFPCGDFNQLRSLSLENTFVKIPESIGGMNCLEILKLNCLTTELPDSIRHLKVGNIFYLC